MTNDSGKKPCEHGTQASFCIQCAAEFYNDDTLLNPPRCPNCERLEGKLEAAHHWFDITTKSNGNLIEENKQLQKQLEMCKVAIKDFLDCSGNIEQNDERLRWLKQAVEKL